MGKFVKACTGIWCRNVKERDQLGDPGVDGRVILKWGFGLGV